MSKNTYPLKFLTHINFNIFLVSVLILFLELFLVRWISTEIRIFAYASNLVLLACFIGIGAGCYFSQKEINVIFSIITLSVLALAVNSYPFVDITGMLAGFPDSVVWSQVLRSDNLIPVTKGIILTLCMFGLVAAVFFPLGATFS